MTTWIEGTKYGEYPFDPNTIGILRLLKEKEHLKAGFALFVGQSVEWLHTYGDKDQRGINISVGRRCKRLIHESLIHLTFTDELTWKHHVNEKFGSYSHAPKHSLYELSEKGKQILRTWDVGYFK